MAGAKSHNDWLAIDFGTCFSSAARIIDNRIVAVKEPIERRTSLPSTVLVTRQGQRVVGYAAERRKENRPRHYLEQFKRDLGKGRTLPLGDENVLPEDLVAAILSFLKQEAEVTGAPRTDAIITVPASYEDTRRTLMEQAASEASFSSVRMLEEPVAAALSRGHDPASGDELLLVYDLGGGTFDGALVHFTNGSVDVLACDGVDDIGGANFDRAIERDLASQAGRADGADQPDQERRPR